MIPTELNTTQLHLLKMFSHLKDEIDLSELKLVLTEFYAKKVDELSDNIWIEKKLSNDKLDEILNHHLRKNN